MECAISPALFVMTIQVILNAAEQRITEAYKVWDTLDAQYNQWRI